VPGANTSETDFNNTDDCSNFFKSRHQKYRRVGGLYIVQVLGEKEKKEEKQEIEIASVKPSRPTPNAQIDYCGMVAAVCVGGKYGRLTNGYMALLEARAGHSPNHVCRALTPFEA